MCEKDVEPTETVPSGKAGAAWFAYFVVLESWIPGFALIVQVPYSELHSQLKLEAAEH